MAMKESTNCIKDEEIIKNHPIYWFNDGSLILDVETQRFKIHHTLVTRHSNFFSSDSSLKKDQTEMSEKRRISNGSDQTSVVSSAALSHVILESKRQVKPQDIEALLQHLYHDVRLDKDTSFSHVLSLLRVSSPQQLDFPNIHAAARRIFESSFPHNPEEFTHKHPLYDALPVAQAFNIPLVTKAIFYSLVSTTDFDVSTASSDVDPRHEGPVTPKSSLELNPDRQESEQTSPEKIVAPMELSPNDAQTCLNLMNRLIAHFTPILFTPPATAHMECTDVFAETWMALVIQLAIENDGVYKPLETLQRIKEIDWAQHSMCVSCIAEKIEEWSEEQRSIWRLMDEWLELPSLLAESSL
ncbi:hypothetical protein CVT25_004120 [Psilocybe cyanescens]|uniref:BTB domain-containing protein n=1 Tax=Psilocybe cyanescens TaxID=93625 RepID=A0A409XKQ1_PSICY|nr:hypothetical protein CVT25_004120 [Psilocybe cyanescens]